jgi:ribulose kinase
MCAAVQEVCGGGYGRRVAGVGFTATCSLVAVDPQGLPVTVSPTRDPQRNVVLWQDHRAATETEEINSLHHHPVLRCVGGALSPEMQPPKLLWLKRHSP